MGIGTGHCQHGTDIELGQINLFAPVQHVQALQFLADGVAPLHLGIGQEFRVNKPIV